MTTHADHRYSVTIETHDLAILYCLRALADYAQKTGNSRIAWGGTKEQDWATDNHCVTFHFSQPDYRAAFVNEASRSLLLNSWKQVREQDNDPAHPQS